MRLSDLIDVAGIAAVAGGLGVRFGWWVTAVTAGTLVMAANWVRAR